MPARPVAQLALPEFTTTALTRPPLACNAARPTSTGAATTRFFVNNAAANAAEHRSVSARARSGRPLALMPAATAENEKPFGKRIFSGERLRPIRSAVMPESSASFWAAAKLRRWADVRGPSALRHSDRAVGIDNNPCGSYREDPRDWRLCIPCARRILEYA